MLSDPLQDGGGSFTGPIVIGYPAASWVSTVGWEEHIAPFVDHLIEASDELPHHWYMHYMHAAEIVGYNHPDQRIAQFWRGVYERMVHRLAPLPGDRGSARRASMRQSRGVACENRCI